VNLVFPDAMVLVSLLLFANQASNIHLFRHWNAADLSVPEGSAPTPF